MNPQAGQIGNGQVVGEGYQSPTYKDLGFSIFLERQPSSYMANSQLDGMVSPFIGQVDESGYLFNPFTDMNQVNQSAVISGNQVQGGQTTSNNGSMTIDYTQGNINFSNGVNSTTVDVNGVSTTPSQ